ncbi:MAG: threonine synthase [Bacteroidetes bacterium]|nr:threonine synthase [Bacteroidota bacterium]
MIYYSLNNPSDKVSFKEATIRGQAPDRGLYFPESIPTLPGSFFDNIANLSREEIAIQVIRPFTGDTLPENELHRIVAETINFDFPLVPVTPTTWSLELFHGPTLAFKDVGARFMSRCLGYFVRGNNKPVTVLVATSGDTGGAVANGFYGVDGVEVVILYPSGKVSSVQELQLTTLGQNIKALEVDGSFDDCQQMVKDAFADAALQQQLFLTSANSINVARWLPQQFYYFFAWQQWADKDHPPVISVPSGNFGNICAGLMAYSAGLPVSHFIAACNANDTIPLFLATGQYRSKLARPTLSNAMDVGNPSNFVRVMEIFGRQLPRLKDVLSAYSISDDETVTTIKDLNTNYHYLPDPHGAVGYLALKNYLGWHPGEKGIFLETAHPVKFYDTVEKVTGEKIVLPSAIAPLLKKEKQSKKISPRYEELKDFLLSYR